MEISHDYILEKMPLNLLLFYAGYFSIKKEIDFDVLEVYWTNEETKNAFYQLYNKELNLKSNILLEVFQHLDKTNVKNSQEKKKLVLESFLNQLEDMFFIMHQKYYDKGQEEFLRYSDCHHLSRLSRFRN